MENGNKWNDKLRKNLFKTLENATLNGNHIGQRVKKILKIIPMVELVFQQEFDMASGVIPKDIRHRVKDVVMDVVPNPTRKRVWSNYTNYIQGNNF